MRVGEAGPLDRDQGVAGEARRHGGALLSEPDGLAMCPQDRSDVHSALCMLRWSDW